MLLTRKSTAVAIVGSVLFLGAGCSDLNKTQQSTVTGGAIGTGVGAAGAAVTGGCVACGAALGGAAGAGGGYLLGKDAENEREDEAGERK